MGIVEQDDENLSEPHRKRKHFLTQEREELVGDSCSIYARPDVGTRVESHVPLKAE
jgi:hypothetical protein